VELINNSNQNTRCNDLENRGSQVLGSTGRDMRRQEGRVCSDS